MFSKSSVICRLRSRRETFLLKGRQDGVMFFRFSKGLIKKRKVKPEAVREIEGIMM
jgi:hypothetical protein